MFLHNLAYLFQKHARFKSLGNNFYESILVHGKGMRCEELFNNAAGTKLSKLIQIYYLYFSTLLLDKGKFMKEKGI